MSTPLQELIDSVISEASQTEKTASAVCDVCGIELTDGGHLCAESQEPTKMASAEGFVDLDYAEKLAGAVEYIQGHIGELDEPHEDKVAAIRRKLAAAHAYGKGGGQLADNASGTPGTQSAKKDKAKHQVPKNTPFKDKTRLEDNESAMHGAYPKEGVIRTKSAAARAKIKEGILQKLGSGVDNPPKISRKESKGPEGVFASEDGPGPTGPGGFEKVRSVKGAIKFTKKDAKAGVRADLAKVLTEPALSKKKDSKLHENLQNASKAGVKIAGVRENLTKVAAAGCLCGGEGSCDHCRLTTAISARRTSV
jgi:hypothetical protein